MTERESDHLLILVEGFYPQTGGGAQTQWKVARAAVKAGYRVSVFTPKLSETARFEKVDSVEIHRPFPGAPDPNDPNSAAGLFARFLFNTLLIPYLLVWCFRHELKAVYSPSHLLHPVAKLLGVVYTTPVINFVAYSPILRGDEIDRSDPRRVFEELNFRFFMGDVAFSRTPQVSELLRSRSDCTVLQAHGILEKKNIESVGRHIKRDGPLEIGISRTAPVLCWVGRVVSIKRPRLAIDILKQLPSNHHLVMVGDGPLLAEVKSYVPQKVEDRVHFPGLLSHDEALKVIAASDGLLLTSETEAYPTVVFEALALETPVFATPVGVLPLISEERLHLSDPRELSALIETTEGTRTSGVDSDVLTRYSITGFASDVIEQVDRLAADSRST